MGRSKGFLCRASMAIIALLVLGSTAWAVEKTVYVGPSLVDCTGDGSQKCLMVRDGPEGNWTLFGGVIDGFAFQPGYQYTLKILDNSSENASIDGEKPRWTLVQILESSETMASGLDDRTWNLVSIQQGDQSTPVTEGRFSADFSLTEGRISGLAGCDSYYAALAVDGDKLSISTPETQKKTCPKAIVDMGKRFLYALENADSFAIEGDLLKIHYAEIGELVFLSVNQTQTPQTEEVQIMQEILEPQDKLPVRYLRINGFF